jgi:large subunit ribosomal protein L9
MEVILRQAVENLGKPGEVVKVSNGYARNYLLPHGVAFEATPGNLKRIQQERDRLEAAENERRGAAQQIADKLEQVQLTFSARVGEEGKLFGSVTSADVVSAVKAAGGPTLDKRVVELSGHIKTVGKHPISVRLHPDVTVAFKLEVTAG